MKKSFIYFLSLFSLFFIIGCTKSPNIDFKTEFHKDIKKILILMPPEKTTELYVYREDSAGEKFLDSGFGVITGPFGLFYNVNKMEEFKDRNELYKKRTTHLKFNADKYFVKRLALYLREERYSVEIIPKNTKAFMKEYSEKNVYFDFMMYGVGYYAENASTTFKPRAYVNAKLIKNKELIYEKIILAGNQQVGLQNLKFEEIVDLGYREEECYKDFNSLMENTDQSVERLKKALDRIAKYIAASLRNK